jgi:hypothetical protein
VVDAMSAATTTDYGARVNFAVSDDEKECWKRAARATGVSFSAWLRIVLNDAATNGRSIELRPPHRSE